MPYAHTKFIFRQDGVPSIEIGSGGVPAGTDPGSIGWVRPAGSQITCTDTNDSYILSAGGTWKQQLNADSTFSDAADTHDMKVETISAPDANSDTAVHAGVAASAGANLFPGPYTNPDVPRRVKCVFGAGWDGGDIALVGTDARDAAANETITNPGAGGGTVVSTKAYKTLTSATKGAVGASGATCSVGTDHGLGTVLVPAAPGVLSVLTPPNAVYVNEAGTWDLNNKVVVPTSMPDASKDFRLEFPVAGVTTTVTATA